MSHVGRNLSGAAMPPLRAGGMPVVLSVVNDVGAAEDTWRALEGSGLLSPYQRFNLLASWQSHVGAASGVEPFLVTGHDALSGEPLFLWPLGLSTQWPLRLVHFLGGKHVSFNVGLWRDDIAANLIPDELAAILAALGHETRADLLVLLRQPQHWRGIENPFAALPHQPCADQCTRLDLDRTGDELIKTVIGSAMRGRLRTKERRLQKLPGYRVTMARTPADVDRLLARFFAMKSIHMAAQGIPNVFTEPGVADFIGEACHRGLSKGQPAIELHALECDDEVLALFGASCDAHRFSLMFNTYTLSDNARQSPGLVLLTHLVEHCAARGMTSFDLGVGAAHYKTFFCKEPEPLFDSFLPLSPLGRLAAHGLGAAHGAKRMVKETPALRDMVSFVRRLRARKAPEHSDPSS